MSDNKDIFKKYIGQRVKFFLKNGFKKEGIVLSVSDNFLELDDIKSGKGGIEMNSILDYTIVGDSNEI